MDKISSQVYNSWLILHIFLLTLRFCIAGLWLICIIWFDKIMIFYCMIIDYYAQAQSIQLKAKCKCDGNTPRRQQLFFKNFFKQMAVASSIFTLGGGFNCLGSFWYAHDRGTIKICIMIQKIVFGHFKKLMEKTHLGYTC